MVKCLGKLTIIGLDNGLSPGRHRAIIWTNTEILLIGPLGTHFSEILIEIVIFSFKKCIWKYRQEIGGYFVSTSMCEHRSMSAFPIFVPVELSHVYPVRATIKIPVQENWAAESFVVLWELRTNMNNATSYSTEQNKFTYS